MQYVNGKDRLKSADLWFLIFLYRFVFLTCILFKAKSVLFEYIVNHVSIYLCGDRDILVPHELLCDIERNSRRLTIRTECMAQKICGQVRCECTFFYLVSVDLCAVKDTTFSSFFKSLKV